MTQESKLVVTVDGSGAKRQTDDLTASLGKMEQAGDRAAESVKGVGPAADGAASKMAALKGVVGSLVGGLAAGLGIQQFGAKLVETAVQTDRLKGSLQTMTGSAAAAGAAFAALEQFAAKTPFSVEQAVEAFIKLKALGLDPSERALTSFGNTSAAMGKSLTQMIEAVADATTGEFERLKEFGIKSSAEGDRVKFTFRGVTTEVGKNSAEIQKYLMELGETNFGDAMKNQMEGLPGQFSELSKAVDGMFRALGDAGVDQAISMVTKGLTWVVNILRDALPVAMGYAKAAMIGAFGAIEESITRASYAGKILALQIKKLWDPSAVEGLKKLTAARDADVAEIRNRTAELKEETINAGYAVKVTADLSDGTKKNTDATNDNSKAQAKLARELKNANDRRQDFIDELEFELRALKLTDREREIEVALRRLGADAAADQIAQTRALVGTIYDEQKALADLEASSEASERAREREADSMGELATSYERGYERMRDAVGDFFQRMLVDGEASFSGLLDMFKTMIAEMIATAAANRIMLAVGMGGASSAASAASGMAGGAGALSKVAGWLGLGGSGGIGPSMGPLAQWKLGMQGVGSSLGFTGPAGFAVGAGLNLGAGFAGGYAGNWAGEKLFGSEGYTGYGSTIGGVAGTILGAGNPLATMLGAALGGIVDSAIGKLVGEKQPKWGALGVTTGTGYNSVVDTMTGASGLTLSAIANRTDEGAARELLQGFADLDGSLTALAAAMGVTVNLSGKTLGGRSLRVDGQGVGDAFGVAGRLDKLDTAALKDAPAQFVRAWLDATADSFDEQIRPFLARIGGTAEEMLTQFGQIAQIQGIYKQSTDTLKALLETDTIGAVRQQIEDANRSLFDLWAQQGDAIVKFSTELADSGDYAQLTAMVQQRYATELQLIAQVMGALQEINGIFSGTIEQIRMDTMGGDAERYAYIKEQIDTLAASIPTMTDAAQIVDTLKQIDALAGRSWGLLDEQGKAANGQAIIDWLGSVEDAAQARLEQVLASVSADGNPNAPGSVGNAIQGALDAASGKMVAELERVFATAAPAQQKAADDLAAAAGQFGQWVNYLPATINVTFAAPEVNA